MQAPTDDGAHESYVHQAAATMTAADVDRTFREYSAYGEVLQRIYAAEAAGVHVAPKYRQGVTAAVIREAQRLEKLEDPTAPLWTAIAESLALNELVRALDWEVTDPQV